MNPRFKVGDVIVPIDLDSESEYSARPRIILRIRLGHYYFAFKDAPNEWPYPCWTFIIDARFTYDSKWLEKKIGNHLLGGDNEV